MRYSVLTVFLTLTSVAFGQNLIVTAEGHHGSAAPLITQDDVSVELNKRPVRIAQWTPLRGEEANLQLYIVIDDGEDTDLGLQFSALKAFIEAQPPSTQIGLAYLRNGSAAIVASLTADHAQVAKALRLPMGPAGIAASPYMGIADLIKKWPAAGARREVLLISSGVDPWSPPDPNDPYLQSAIGDAQRAGVLVHSIYYGGAGHFGHSYWRMNWGQNYLSELGDQTGGEAYWQGNGNPVSFEPYLKDLTARLQNQYLLTIEPENSKPGLEQIKVSTSHTGVSLEAASRVNLK